MTKVWHIITALAVSFALAMLSLSCGGGGGGSLTGVHNVTGVRVDPEHMTLMVGDGGQIRHAVAPVNATVKTVSWKSGNVGVATVDQSGRVEGKSDGYADITVTTQDGGFTATCEVYVSSNIVPVTSVSLNKGNLSLSAGESEKLTATVQPSNATDKTVTWSTNDAGVATVSSDGLVRAVAPGSAQIVVTTNYGGRTAYCSVTVTAPVSDVTLSQSSMSLTVGGATGSLTATVAPSNATNKNVTWSSSDTAKATVSGSGLNATVTPTGAGTATIFVATQDGDKRDSCTVTVAAAHVPVTGVTLNQSSMSLTASGATVRGRQVWQRGAAGVDGGRARRGAGMGAKTGAGDCAFDLSGVSEFRRVGAGFCGRFVRQMS